jgi:hypothetical protein
MSRSQSPIRFLLEYGVCAAKILAVRAALTFSVAVPRQACSIRASPRRTSGMSRCAQRPTHELAIAFGVAPIFGNLQSEVEKCSVIGL